MRRVISTICWAHIYYDYLAENRFSRKLQQWGCSTWESLESHSIPWYRSVWRIKDFQLVLWRGTHEHGLVHNSSRLHWPLVTQQDHHTILHLHEGQESPHVQARTANDGKVDGKNKHPKSNRTVLLELNSHSVFSLIDFLIKNSQWDDECLMLKNNVSAFGQCFAEVWKAGMSFPELVQQS